MKEARTKERRVEVLKVRMTLETRETVNLKEKEIREERRDVVDVEH